jgi:Signal transduction histidine kinase
MYEILDRRIKEQTSQIVSVDMTNHHVNKLAKCINECLKAEEYLRLNSVREEKKFKELISNISHDLRTPLTAIKGYQQMLEKEPLTKEQQSKLRIAMKHTDVLGQLIEQFFEYTYISNYASNCNPERVNLTNQMAEYLTNSIVILEENHIEVKYEDSIPVYILVDRELLGRIIQNLIRNCVQYGCGTIHVCMIEDVSNKNGPMAGVSIANKVPDNHNIHVLQLFDRFYTADSTRKQSTGLGLNIVKQLTEQMNGTVSAQLEEDILDIRVMFPKS